jgi:hypothetical protein
MQWRINLIWNEKNIFLSKFQGIHVHVVNFISRYWWKFCSNYLHGLLNVVAHDVSCGTQRKVIFEPWCSWMFENYTFALVSWKVNDDILEIASI